MTTILLDSDYFTDNEMADSVLIANKILSKWAVNWKITPLIISDPTQPFDMVAHITDVNRHTTALGYHTTESGVRLYHGNGVHTSVLMPTHLLDTKEPTAYISPSALLHNVYGTYTEPHWSIALWNLARTKITRASKQTLSARYREGIITVLLHELMEMVVDKNIDVYSKPDLLKRQWVVEVCDHVCGMYAMETVNGNICIIPNATLPSYYDINGKSPFDFLGKLSKPFDQSAPKFYGYYLSANGILMKVQ